MKYSEINVETARKCCKDHKAKCENCPLRRERQDSNNKIHTLFCYFIIKELLDKLSDEYIELLMEDIQHENEWLNYNSNLLK